MPELPDDIREIQNTFARFSDEQIAPKAEAIDEAADFPREAFQAIADLGFFGMRYPEEVGGLGLGLLAYCKAIEEIARGSVSVAACVSMQAMMGTNFVHSLGTADHHERLLKPALAGEKIGSICITEPNAGTDLGSISTSAVEVDDGYRLNGQKMWVTMAPYADFFTVFARAGEDKKLTMFLLEKGFEGLDVGRPIHKMGVRALDSRPSLKSPSPCSSHTGSLQGEAGSCKKAGKPARKEKKVAKKSKKAKKKADSKKKSSKKKKGKKKGKKGKKK